MTTDVTTSQEVDFYSPLDPAALPDDPVVLKQILLQVLSLLRKETKRREQVERNLDVLLRKLTSTKSNEPAPGQKVLFDVAALFDEAPPPEPTPPTRPQPTPPRHTPHGRRKPPANVPQVDVIHDLPPELKEQLGPDNLIPLPDVITFQYDYEPSKHGSGTRKRPRVTCARRVAWRSSRVCTRWNRRSVSCVSPSGVA